MASFTTSIVRSFIRKANPRTAKSVPKNIFTTSFLNSNNFARANFLCSFGISLCPFPSRFHFNFTIHPHCDLYPVLNTPNPTELNACRTFRFSRERRKIKKKRNDVPKANRSFCFEQSCIYQLEEQHYQYPYEYVLQMLRSFDFLSLLCPSSFAYLFFCDTGVQ